MLFPVMIILKGLVRITKFEVFIQLLTCEYQFPHEKIRAYTRLLEIEKELLWWHFSCLPLYPSCYPLAFRAARRSARDVAW